MANPQTTGSALTRSSARVAQMTSEAAAKVNFPVTNERSAHGAYDLTIKPRVREADLDAFESAIKPQLTAVLREKLVQLKSIKYKFTARLRTQRPLDDDDDELVTLRSHDLHGASKKKGSVLAVLNERDISRTIDQMWAKIKKDWDDLTERGSGWRLEYIQSLRLEITRYRPIRGSSYIPSPDWIAAKKAVINVRNNDQRCLAWAVASARHPAATHSERPSKYAEHLNELDYSMLEWPAAIDQLPEWEETNKVAVTVFSVDVRDENKRIELIYKASIQGEPIPLLLLRDGDAGHYCWIKSLQGLLRQKAGDLQLCTRCLHPCSSVEALKGHLAKNKCLEAIDETLKVLPAADKAVIEFKSPAKTTRSPFCVYAKIEVREQMVGEKRRLNPIAVKAQLLSDHPNKLAPVTKEFDSENAIGDFLVWLSETERAALRVTRQCLPMNALTAAEKAAYRAEIVQCHICAKPCNRKDRCRDHDHQTGAYIGPAHYQCNIHRNFKHWQLPCFIMDFKTGANHLLPETKHISRPLSTGDKFISLRSGRTEFKDPASFLPEELIPTGELTEVVTAFEAFRKLAVREYKVDPAWFITGPQFSWNALLKTTGAKINVFSAGQEDMLEFVEGSIRGGLSQVSHRFARANNPSVPGYDPSKPTSSIIALDCNSMYPHGMQQALPISEYAWSSATLDEILATPDYAETGYRCEVDLHAPVELHDLLADLPPCPENAVFEASPHTIEHRERLGLKADTVPKLIASLSDKKQYRLDYRLLKCCVELGMKVTKLHRVLQFKQTDYMRPYIDLTAALRAKASQIDSVLFKFMMNSPFGKTIEKVENRPKIKFCRTEAELAKCADKNTFARRSIISEGPNGLVAAHVNATRVTANKPIIVGATILDQGRAHLYRFFYQLKAKFGNRVRLLYTDTDSLYLLIESEDAYGELATLPMMDWSNLPEGHPLKNDAHKQVPGYWKDEARGRVIAEFIGLRSKMYSVLFADDDAKAKAKGLPSAPAHEAYRAALTATGHDTVTFESVRCTDHQVQVETVTRRGLCPCDGKRFVLDDGISTLPHGHHSIETK